MAMLQGVESITKGRKVDGYNGIKVEFIHGYIIGQNSLKYQLSCKMYARTFIFYLFEIQYVMRLRSYRILWRFIIRKSFKGEV